MAENILELLAKYEPKEGENLFSSPDRRTCVLGSNCELTVFLDGVSIYNNISIENGIVMEYNKPSFSAYLEADGFQILRKDFTVKDFVSWLKENATENEGAFTTYNVIKNHRDDVYYVRASSYKMGFPSAKGSGSEKEKAEKSALLANKINFLNFLMGDYDAIEIAGKPYNEHDLRLFKVDLSCVPIAPTENGLYFGTGSDQTIYDEYGPGKQTETNVFSAVSLQKLTEKKVVGNNGKYGIEEKDYYRVESSDAVNNEAPYVGYAENFDSLEEAGKTFISECRRIEKKHHGERNVDLIDLAANKHLEDFAKLEQSRSVSKDADKPKAVSKKKAKTVER
jgi:hypothetical protein